MPEWIFTDYKIGKLTFDRFNKETNEDIRAGIITMIKEREGIMSEIAYSVGFNSPAYFSKCFKDEFGYSPSEMDS